MEKEEIRKIILEIIENSLEAQLRSVKRLRDPEAEKQPKEKSKSQMGLVHDVLVKVGKPLHINEIIEQIHVMHGRKLDRESLVSALSKKVIRDKRFVRTAKNTFSIREGESDAD
jgi:hypothetical protein